MVLAVLGAALLHATWNALAHGMDDRLAGFTLMSLVYAAIGGAAALVTGFPTAAAWPYVLASAAAHVLYQVGLMLSYRLGQFGQVYPLARGTAPWVVALTSAALLGQRISVPELAGVLVISAGLTSLVLVGGRPTAARFPALAAAFGTGLVIALYTVLDGVGVHRTDVLTYAAWLFLLQGLALPPLALAVRGRALPAQLRSAPGGALLGGVLSLAAYGIVLWAQTRGALAPIAALRETSIVFGALIGAVLFRERLGRGRVLASAVVLAGIVLLNLP
ncbi:DMT family transporter [Saccharopolyspora sp. 6M]|uniref:DMT family transporter n=1 Tax=Saccharopolyspora sp. 6M TaxID=2877237 RepID=UPI001CD7ECCE|nr:DMT family transporter [Saccharopolyspora sp. 6M]MCA1229821.1 DMT family transporter [Saccharopolyspora sp. 6M]